MDKIELKKVLDNIEILQNEMHEFINHFIKTTKNNKKPLEYDPISNYGFYCDNIMVNTFDVYSAVGVIINKYGVHGANLN